MKNTKKSIFLILCLIILITISWSYQKLFLKTTSENPLDIETNTEKKATIIVNNGASVTVNQITFQGSATAFDLLQKIAEENNWPIQTTDYGDMGLLIESIDGVKNGTGNKYWMYYINSNQPQVSVSKQSIDNNDLVEFKFEESNF